MPLPPGYRARCDRAGRYPPVFPPEPSSLFPVFGCRRSQRLISPTLGRARRRRVLFRGRHEPDRKLAMINRRSVRSFNSRHFLVPEAKFRVLLSHCRRADAFAGLLRSANFMRHGLSKNRLFGSIHCATARAACHCSICSPRQRKGVFERFRRQPRSLAELISRRKSL